MSELEFREIDGQNLEVSNRVLYNVNAIFPPMDCKTVSPNCCLLGVLSGTPFLSSNYRLTR